MNKRYLLFHNIKVNLKSYILWTEEGQTRTSNSAQGEIAVTDNRFAILSKLVKVRSECYSPPGQYTSSPSLRRPHYRRPFCLVNTTAEKCPSDTDNCQFEKRPAIRGRFTVTPTGCSSTSEPNNCNGNSTTEVSYCCSGDNCNLNPFKFHCYYGHVSDAIAVPCDVEETSCRIEHQANESSTVGCGGDFCKNKEEGCHSKDEHPAHVVCCCRGKLCNKNDLPLEEDGSAEFGSASGQTVKGVSFSRKMKQFLDLFKQYFLGVLKRLTSVMISM